MEPVGRVLPSTQQRLGPQRKLDMTKYKRTFWILSLGFLFGLLVGSSSRKPLAVIGTPLLAADDEQTNLKSLNNDGLVFYANKPACQNPIAFDLPSSWKTPFESSMTVWTCR
jgi:hypothetical protein